MVFNHSLAAKSPHGACHWIKKVISSRWLDTMLRRLKCSSDATQSLQICCTLCMRAVQGGSWSSMLASASNRSACEQRGDPKRRVHMQRWRALSRHYQICSQAKQAAKDLGERQPRCCTRLLNPAKRSSTSCVIRLCTLWRTPFQVCTVSSAGSPSLAIWDPSSLYVRPHNTHALGHIC